jgi:hypothetical protein
MSQKYLILWSQWGKNRARLEDRPAGDAWVESEVV